MLSILLYRINYSTSEDFLNRDKFNKSRPAAAPPRPPPGPTDAFFLVPFHSVNLYYLDSEKRGSVAAPHSCNYSGWLGTNPLGSVPLAVTVTYPGSRGNETKGKTHRLRCAYTIRHKAARG